MDRHTTAAASLTLLSAATGNWAVLGAAEEALRMRGTCIQAHSQLNDRHALPHEAEDCTNM